MKRAYLSLIVTVVLSSNAYIWAATNNSGNNPTFLVVEMISNGWKLHADQEGPNTTIDIGVDIGADGTYDYWMSEDRSIVREGSTNQEEIFVDNLTSESGWMHVLIALDQYAGEMAKIKIVDKSDTAYIAVNYIRLNNADGKVVANNVPNGWFEATPALTGWHVIAAESNLTATQVLVTDEEFRFSASSTKFINTKVNGNEGKIVLESDPFVLTPVSSFVYGAFAGPVSAYFDKHEAWLTDNGIKVFVDVGTATQDPDGVFTEGVDVPLTGVLFDDSDPNRISLQANIFNTSGLEGRRARVVAVDDDRFDGIGLDCIRMNYDTTTIRNGNFEEGFENGYPTGFITNPSDTRNPVKALSAHPSGGLPGWTQYNHSTNTNAQWTFFGWPGSNHSREGRVWVSSGSLVGAANNDNAVRDYTGLELWSDVFVIQPIPDAANHLFYSFEIGQTAYKAQPDGLFKDIQMQVDVNENNSFTDTADYAYKVRSQAGGWNREQYAAGGIDEWNYPQYRFYVQPDHQGLMARFHVEDRLTSEWAWMGVDDFYFWNGQTADLAFPNSDFEMGDLTNWEGEIANGLSSWLSGTQEMFDAGLATQVELNDHISYVDGNFAADSAGGDEATGVLNSAPFLIPETSSKVSGWSLY